MKIKDLTMRTTNPSHTSDDKNATRTQLIQEAQAQQAKRDDEIARLTAVFFKNHTDLQSQFQAKGYASTMIDLDGAYGFYITPLLAVATAHAPMATSQKSYHRPYDEARLDIPDLQLKHLPKAPAKSLTCLPPWATRATQASKPRHYFIHDPKDKSIHFLSPRKPIDASDWHVMTCATLALTPGLSGLPIFEAVVTTDRHRKQPRWQFGLTAVVARVHSEKQVLLAIDFRRDLHQVYHQITHTEQMLTRQKAMLAAHQMIKSDTATIDTCNAQITNLEQALSSHMAAFTKGLNSYHLDAKTVENTEPAAYKRFIKLEASLLLKKNLNKALTKEGKKRLKDFKKWPNVTLLMLYQAFNDLLKQVWNSGDDVAQHLREDGSFLSAPQDTMRLLRIDTKGRNIQVQDNFHKTLRTINSSVLKKDYQVGNGKGITPLSSTFVELKLPDQKEAKRTQTHQGKKHKKKQEIQNTSTTSELTGPKLAWMIFSHYQNNATPRTPISPTSKQQLAAIPQLDLPNGKATRSRARRHR